MSSLHSLKFQFAPNFTSSLHKSRHLQFFAFSRSPFSGKLQFVWTCPETFKTKGDNHLRSVRSLCKTKDAEIEKVKSEEQLERPPFDINLAVILAGFAFEAYTSPPEKSGRREVDAAGCKTVFLSESFVREIYDGQLFIKLKKGIELPAMDPWGTSDPYVIMELDGQVVKSKIKWGTKEPTWNEDLTFNIKLPATRSLQIAAWDANLVTPHKRMGNAGLSLEYLCDGDLHEVLVELGGMGGGGKLQLEVKYKSFDEIEEEKKWWQLPIVTEFLKKNGFESALKMFSSSDAVTARQFVEYAFGQLKLFSESKSMKDLSSNSNGTENLGISENAALVMDRPSQMENGLEASLNDTSCSEESDIEKIYIDNDVTQSDKHFWKNFADVINQNVVQKLGLPVQDKLKWDAFDILNKVGLQLRKTAEAAYIESGLATPEFKDNNNNEANGSSSNKTVKSSLPNIKKATKDLLKQTDSVLGALMVLTTAVSQLNKEEDATQNNEKFPSSLQDPVLDEKKAEEMKTIFSSAESAMEAWAMLATSLGHPSFIKSEFEKICFLDNESTDTQVAIWRDFERKRLVIAFRGTEQVKWKDLRTDLMLVPAGDDGAEPLHKWHVYVTGHSLGGALATLFALELSSSKLAKIPIFDGNRHGAISLTMYNFGSPRVGNKKFADVYNEKVKDSWRVVNHRDIIPTVPRWMGYCHVAQPVYLTTGYLKDALETMEVLKDAYQPDVYGESTPDVIVSEFMKGEKELIEKILQTEIKIFRSIRDGSALMQHMEDFYYISLLENVRKNYVIGKRSQNDNRSIS
ncbi:uncharacterized protein LOC123221926 isoform X3 [Mangifera indica]|uniref:uncharacterized protein LOC123221926 isoform X3 n=1 Tax=Mangifera indica TaxID=29780 RepID=UPI001CFBF4D3|nr:uncharacterized protein LOC123221926 isoform X3 [Mangifera indica]